VWLALEAVPKLDAGRGAEPIPPTWAGSTAGASRAYESAKRAAEKEGSALRELGMRY